MLSLFRSKEKDRKIDNNIIQVMHDYYDTARSKFPNKRDDFYLAFVWALYAKKNHLKQYQNHEFSDLILIASSDTLTFSFLEPPDSINALSYYMLHKEGLSVAKEYEPKFNEIVAKIKITQDQFNEAVKEMTQYFVDEMEILGELTEKDFY